MEAIVPQFFTTIQNYNAHPLSYFFSFQQIGFVLVAFFSLILLTLNRIKFNNRLIVTRQKLVIFHLFAIFSIVAAIFTRFSITIENFYMLAYLPVILTIFIENNKVKVVNELLFLIICLGLWL